MSQASIRKAFEKRLKSMGTFPTQYENIDFKPVTGTAYQKAFLLPSKPDNPTIGDGYYREMGVFQVTLCYPPNKSSIPAQTRAELIRAEFVRGLGITENTTTVTVTQTPQISPSFMIDDRYCIAVSIYYQASIFN